MNSTKQKFLSRPVITYGLIGGTLIVGFMFFGGYFMGEDGAGRDNGELIGYLSMIVSLSTILLGINESRKASSTGSFSFWDGFKVGLLITLIASTLYVIGWMYYSAQYAPDFMEQYVQREIEAREAVGASAEEISAYTDKMAVYIERYKNPFFKALITFSEILPVGLGVSLIGGLAFMRRKEE